MTVNPANPASRPSLGRALGEMSRLVGKLHRRALADFDSDFPTWMLLTLLTEKGVPLPVDEVAKELGRRLDLAEPDTLRVLERAAAAGHVTYRPGNTPATAELTEEGADHFGALYAHAREATDAAFEGIGPADLDTALTVMLAAKERAAILLG
ncbi:MarR family winged helix-turn-helix transcriptional regulator [Microbispora sp. NPDC049125]|uniref:MarR family winged helix-turn-helix transcriptional regulator n=1 Tax=Microbispora sp. NPDC049125 TaxID=3154929 RepID=UPI003465EB4D